LWEYRGEKFHFVRTIREYKYPVVGIVYVGVGLAVATDDAIINIWDLKMLAPLWTHDLSQLPFKLYSLKIKDLVWAKNKLLLTTYSGDFVTIHTEPKKLMKKDSFLYLIDGKRYRNIVKLNGKLTCSLLIQKEAVAPAHQAGERTNDSLLMVGSESSAVESISLRSRELVEVGSVGDQIICMDGIQFPSGAFLTVFGTSKGKIIIKIDWEYIPNTFEADGSIRCLKITTDSEYLVAASDTGSLYVFTKQYKNYFYSPPKR